MAGRSFFSDGQTCESELVRKTLGKLAGDRNPQNRIAAATVAAQLNTPADIELLIKMVKDRDWQVSCSAIDGLGIIAPSDAELVSRIEEVVMPMLAKKEGLEIAPPGPWRAPWLGAGNSRDDCLRRPGNG